jgi:hypothetical protein
MPNGGNSAQVEALESRLFLSAAAGGTVRGLVFSDSNGDGARSKGEAGLRDFTVYLDANANATRDAGEATATTRANGSYQFRGVAPGSHAVRVELPFLAAATGDGAAPVVAAGRRAARVEPLGVTGAGQIRGTVSEIMGVELPQVVGPAVAVRVFVDSNGDGRWQRRERSTRTDPAGHYAFTGLFAGDFRVIAHRKGWGTREQYFDATLGPAFSTTEFASFQIYWLGPGGK